MLKNLQFVINGEVKKISLEEAVKLDKPEGTCVPLISATFLKELLGKLNGQSKPVVLK